MRSSSILKSLGILFALELLLVFVSAGYDLIKHNELTCASDVVASCNFVEYLMNSLITFNFLTLGIPAGIVLVALATYFEKHDGKGSV